MVDVGAMSVFNYNRETKLQTFYIDSWTPIEIKPRTIVYYPENDKWIVVGKTYPVREKLSVIAGSLWDTVKKEWSVPYTEENRVLLENLRLLQETPEYLLAKSDFTPRKREAQSLDN